MLCCHDARVAGVSAVPHTIPVGARSLFVTFTGWLFLLLGAAASVFALLQNAAVDSLLVAAPVPWVVEALPVAMRAALVLSLALFACSIGLLRRQDWARRLFIVLMGLTLAVNLAGLGLQHVLLQALVDRTLVGAPMPAQAAEVLGGFVTATRTLAVLMTLAMCGALLSVIRRLMSAAVRHEFA
jgi:hypothetical protein